MSAPRYRALAIAVHPASEIAAWRKCLGIEGWRAPADHSGNRSPRRRPGREADMLVAEGEPQTGTPGRRSNHWQTIGQCRSRSTPGFAHGITKFDHTACDRHHLIELGEG